MSAQHAPGPWKQVRYDDGEHLYVPFVSIEAEGKESRVATVGLVKVGYHGTQADLDESNANARLIAAAPELLAACKTALETFGQVSLWRSPAAEGLRVAIAKATGEVKA